MSLWDGLIALFLAAIGSFFGAYGAQWIVEREGRRRRALDDLRSTNTAIVLSGFALNSVLDVRRQHLRGLIEKFEKDEEEAKRVLGAGSGTISVQADYEQISLPRIELEKLSDTLLYHISLPNRALTVANLALATISHLEATLAERNAFADEMRNRQWRDERERVWMYLGWPYIEGQTDRRYPSYISAIKSYTADTALFFALLIEELIRHGGRVATELKKKPWQLGQGTATEVSKIDMSHAFREGGIPLPSEYGDLLRRLGFDPDVALREHREKAARAE